MKYLAMLALIVAAAGCTETRVGRSTIDDKYGGMDSNRSGQPVNSVPVNSGTGGSPMPWKSYKAY